VLSFAADADEYAGHEPLLGADAPLLGDIAICAPVVVAEAAAQGKRAEDHLAHMVVHGVLHLCGYDHEKAADAQVMEGHEVAILSALGIDDPYVR
jgi:probable rRNA maturation factor